MITFIPIFFRRFIHDDDQNRTHITVYFPERNRAWYLYEPFDDAEWEWDSCFLKHVAGEASFDFLVVIRV
jgi:hypothetical protein